jgi:PHD/YefM family antitoxin component YafN of YafNO toxin-antitoxin module
MKLYEQCNALIMATINATDLETDIYEPIERVLDEPVRIISNRGAAVMIAE